MKIPLHLRRFHRSSRLGFTLMEMIIVLAIIALLMGLVIANLNPIRGVAEEKKTRADILSLGEALSAYQLQTGSLPTTDQGLKALWEKPTTAPIPDQWRKIMDEEVVDPWDHPYQYQYPGKHNTDGYDVWSNGSGDGRVFGNWKDSGSEATSTQ